MKKTKHLFEEQVYLISNHAVALNPMFDCKAMQDYFKNKMESYLSPICHILAYSLEDNEYQLLVKLKKREDFVQLFFEKNKDIFENDIEAPPSTYVFSQSMANMQVSFVKHYNYVNSRSGTLMAGRFSRKLVETQEEMQMWKDRLNKGVRKHNYSEKWINKMGRSEVQCTSLWMYEGADSLGFEELGNVYVRTDNYYLGGSWKSKRKYELSSNYSFFFHRLNQLFHLRGRART